jgi:Holliday junction resolvase
MKCTHLIYLYVNQHTDRLINDQNWNELIQFIRRFMSNHYILLRKKDKNVHYLKLKMELN